MGLCLRESVCALPKSLRSRVTHDTKLWKGMCSSPAAKRSEISCTILPSHCIPVGSGSVEGGSLVCILVICQRACVRVCVCVHSTNTDGLQRRAELEGAHGSRRVLIKLEKGGLKQECSQIITLLSSVSPSHTRMQRLRTCRLRKLDSRVSACLRLRLARPLDWQQS